VIQQAKKETAIPIIHVWQDDQGFRAAKARNQAVAASRGEILFFLDGDCLIDCGFLTRLRGLMQSGYFLAGNRILLTESFTQQVIEQRIPVYRFGALQWLKTLWKRGCNRIGPLLRLPLGPLRALAPNRFEGAKTCNLAVWRQDYLAVNGFDESFQGWGYEDSDLVVRLLHRGVKRYTTRFACPVIHLWHPVQDRSQERSNWDRLMEVVQSNKIKADQGISQYLVSKKRTLGVIVITHNEASQIEQCLESVTWADQIVVVDSGSTDDTVAIAKRYTPHVIETDWPGFGPQRNKALLHVKTEWVLFVDADEKVTPELKEDLDILLQAELAPPHVGYRILRRSAFMGRVLTHGDWGRDYVLRLFKRGVGHYSDSKVHERCIVEGSIGTLETILFHNAVRSIEQALNKMNSYSSLGVGAPGASSTWGLLQAVGHGSWTFIRGYLFRAGFLDGQEGFLIAVLNGGGSFFKYVKRLYVKE
jgi:glycosyltransferase involved in cell wall biosynthesis